MDRKTLWITGAASAALALGGATVAVAGNSTNGDQALGGQDLQAARDAAIAHTGPGTVVGAEPENVGNSAYEVDVRLDNGNRVEVNLDRSFGVVQSAQDEGSGPPLSADERDRAGQAALASVGQGQLSEVERENEGGAAFEAEIILPDGAEVEVQLGADFQVLNTGAPERH